MADLKIYGAVRVCRSKAEALELAQKMNEIDDCCGAANRPQMIALEFEVDAFRSLSAPVRIGSTDFIAPVGCRCTEAVRCEICVRWATTMLAIRLLEAARVEISKSAAAAFEVASILVEELQDPAGQIEHIPSNPEAAAMLAECRKRIAPRQLIEP